MKEGDVKMAEEQQYCHGCRYLLAKSDAACGGIYFCGLLSNGRGSGIVIGEWGCWTDESDKPKRCDKFKQNYPL